MSRAVDWKREIQRQVRGEVRLDEPLSEHTSYRIGGPAVVFAVPASVDDVKWLVRFCTREGIDLLVLGRGANLLVSDAGFAGVVLDLRRVAGTIELRGREVRAGAGVELMQLVETTCSAGLSGLESLAGIPGTVGGAAVMNAGAFGTEFFDRALELEVLTFSGEVETVAREKIGYGYRRGFDPSDGIVLSARFLLEEGEATDLTKRVQQILARREEKQPLEYPSCGSVFKRPEGDFAGRLIEAAGLKGLRRGGAEVSSKHANFIVNLGGATAADVIWLIREVRRRVYEKFGVALEPEVRLVGFDKPVQELLALN